MVATGLQQASYVMSYRMEIYSHWLNLMAIHCFYLVAGRGHLCCINTFRFGIQFWAIPLLFNKKFNVWGNNWKALEK